MAARISKIFLYKNPESEYFIKNPNLTKKFWRLGGEGVGGRGVARLSDLFYLFSKESKSEKNLFSF